MTDRKLRDDLERLRTEVQALSTDSDARARLDDLVDRIENRLDIDDENADHPPLVDTVKETITHFETEHPRATAILNDIMVALSNMGI